MAKQMWIGPYPALHVGEYGFLIKQCHLWNGRVSQFVSPLPARSNDSGEARLKGWCGTWNDVATHAAGVVVVERRAMSAHVLVRELEGDQLDAALELLGFPELMPTE